LLSNSPKLNIMLRYLLLFAFLFSTITGFSQKSLSSIVKKINPEVFMNNMESERIYQQATINDDLITFTRDYKDRETENVQRVYRYYRLKSKKGLYILEFKLDKRKIKINALELANRKPISYCDFGFKVYHLPNKKEVWKEATISVLPANFLYKMKTTFPDLQKGAEMYYYNLDMTHLVEIDFKKAQVHFLHKEKPVLKLQWKKNAFVWK